MYGSIKLRSIFQNSPMKEKTNLMWGIHSYPQIFQKKWKTMKNRESIYLDKVKNCWNPLWTKLMNQSFSNIARLWQGVCPICSDRAKFLFKFFLKRLKPFCKTPVQNYKTDMIINKIAGNRSGWIKERKNLTNPVKKGFPQCESGKTAVIHLFHWFQPNKGFSLSTFSRKMEKSFG